MPHSFEQPRPDHQIHNMKMPMGHGAADQKHDKGMRSPMVGQLPMANGLESPGEAPGLMESEGTMGG